MVDSIISKVIRKIRDHLLRPNVISLTKDSLVGNGVQFGQADLFGYFELGEGVSIRHGVTMRSGSAISIGRYTSVSGPNTDMHCLLNPIRIGSFCSIARDVHFQEYNHDYRSLSTYNLHSKFFGGSPRHDSTSKGSIEVGHDVWIGSQSLILSGASIGHGAIVAANTVVTGDVPPYAIVAGSPAKVVAYRFDEAVIQELLTMRWWTWDINRIVANKDLFTGPLTLSKLKTYQEK